MITLTKEMIEACESLCRTYTIEAIRILAGEDWIVNGQPKHGWKLHAIGRRVSREDYALALESKSRGFHRAENAERQMTLL